MNSLTSPQLPSAPSPARPAPLDPLRFPLQGSRLIEASAGTGKTFTIATLYVRLVLGHRPAAADECPDQPGETEALVDSAKNVAANPGLTPPEILVVTFTEAATQELRDRIRSRLTEAAGYFRAQAARVPARPAGEDPLHDLRLEYPPEQWPGCAHRLQLAAEWMDEAAVSTIHAWCNRMLREHAFDSGSLFTQTLETDQSELRAEVVRDYWRTFMVPLAAGAVAEIRPWWSDPAGLEQNLQGLVDHADRLDAGAEPAAAIETARKERDLRLAEIKAPWAGWVDELQTLLDDAVAAKRVNGHKLQARFYTPWLLALRDWATDPQAVWPALGANSAAWMRLTPQGLQEAWKQGEPPPHPAPAAMLSLPNALNSLPDAHDAILCHAARWVHQRFAAEQARRAQMGFNDLLTRLDAALQGPQGDRLATTIRRQFPVALIDEFQDTDPVQYRIFDAVYRVASNDPATALILIGDPKQAIYAFRGADIFTYLQARQACAGRLYTLGKNFRATEAMVRAANSCFLAAEERATGQGAFLFRREGENPVPFTPAAAQGRADVLQDDGQALPALTAWWLPPPDTSKTLAREAYRDQIAEVCASEMVRLLVGGQAGRTGFLTPGEDQPLRKLLPADLAVLVNKRAEADLIRQALARRGVRSVYLSDQDSVFQSPQARELQHWLAACADPDDTRRVRAALATPTLGLNWAALDQLNQDELALEGRVLQFRGYRDLWRRQGVLPMLRGLLNDFRVPARLLGGIDPGERVLTDLLHLAELLQQASGLLDGEHALMRYLAEECQDAAQGAGGDARLIRLETDADLVRVVTVHKSKGLEYPLVFLPFAADYRPVTARDLPLKWHDDQGQPQLSLSAPDEVLERANHERLGEDLRKFYVALTRARYATWVGLGPINGLEQGAFGYLLGDGEPLAPGDLAAALAAWRGDCADIALVPAPAPTEQAFRPQAATAALGTARASRQVVSEPWWIASYSAIGKTLGGGVAVGGAQEDAGGDADGHAARTAAETPTEERFLEMQAARTAVTEAPAPLATPPGLTETPEAQGFPVSQKPAPIPASQGTAAIPASPKVTPAPGSPHAFPRGPEAGTFLHDLLEWAANQGFAAIAADPGRLRDTVARRCQSRGWEAWIEPLTAWLLQLITQPLRLPVLGDAPSLSLRLADLTHCVPEMEFWLAAHRVDTQVIDRLVSDYTLGGAPRPALATNLLNGMLKGFMDLVFEHRGRYYVADYKSNWLGPDAAAYSPEAMGAEILHARYELQYVLYLLALHRLLQARLPDYDYDRHIGGAVYLFLRGLAAPSQGLHCERPPRRLIEDLDRLFIGATQEVTA
jgi:exodeoxyribonuclease V beta subunit